MSYTIVKNTTKTLKIKISGSSTFEVDVDSYAGSCSNPPTQAMYTDSEAAANYIADIATTMALNQETFSDQEGILGALVIWTQARALEAENYADFWQGKHATCMYNQNPFSFWCKTHASTCSMKETALFAHYVLAVTFDVVWLNLENTLVNQLKQVQENELIYSTNQQLQALLTQVLANTNVVIAESNIKVQAAENRLLDLKRKELEQKSLYIIIPLVVVLAIALIYND
tara:strand:- start:537 stop:1223 length:687 start_codon:yes stop_codon:yes gene_type:complete